MYELYPLKFVPIYKETLWGGDNFHAVFGRNTANKKNLGESWEISTIPGNISIVSNGFLKGNTLSELIEVYMGDLVGDRIFDRHGLDFPLLLKFIDAREKLSLQVHPGEELARARHNSPGKSELWYVIHAGPGAEIICGFREHVDMPAYLHAVENNTLDGLLNTFEASEGDSFYIPAGTVHAIGAGIMIAEIQTPSDLTYRIHDWNRTGKDGRPRELHASLATEAITFTPYNGYGKCSKHPDSFNNICNCEHFVVNYVQLVHRVERDLYPIDTFALYMCLSGNCIIRTASASTTLAAGETVLIPASSGSYEITTDAHAGLLEIYMPHE